jgi:hypothetical protein
VLTAQDVSALSRVEFAIPASDVHGVEHSRQESRQGPGTAAFVFLLARRWVPGPSSGTSCHRASTTRTI